MSNDYNGKKRSELPDSVFGIPQERKYPMPDEKHTRSAIKLFNHVDPKYEEQLAKAVIKNMKKYNIDGSVVGPNNRLRKYLPKDMIKESASRPLIYTWERANIPEYSVIQESSNKSDFSYSGINTSTEKSEFKRNFREVFKEDPTESSVNYMQMIKYKGDLVGYIGFSRYKEGKKKYLGIGNFMILKRYQRSGMGSKVISDIIDRYKDNYDEIYCYVDKDNTNAIAFYKKIAKVNTDNLTKYGYYVTLYSKSIGESYMLESSIPEEIPNDIRELLRRLNSYDYGYIKNGKKIKGMKNFFEDYKSLTISEFEKYQIGVCWDYVHYEAYWFAKNHYKYETFYIQVQDEDNDCPSHTYLVFYLPNSSKVYYFESSWGKYQGIEAFDNIIKLHNTIKERHIESARSKCDPKTYFRNKYDAKSSRWEHLSCGDYMVKVSNGKVKVNKSYVEESSNIKVYHLAQTNLDGKTIQPTVPSNYMTKNGYEDGKTKRVCFATSIDGCLRGLSQKCEGMKLFVHVPDGNYNIYKPSNKEVPDASITGEVWIKKAVKMKCIGQIYVIGDKGEDGIPYKYGDKTAELYDWEWKWIDKFNESVSILPQDTGISTVIFDIGDVLVSANIKDYLVADPEVPNEIVDELLKLWFIDKDEVDDTMDLDTYREIVNKRMGVEFSKYIPKLFQYNVDCVTAFDYTIPMIQDLKDKGYKVYYLSNWSAWTYDLLQEAGKFDFLKLMDGGVFSYDAGYMKPNEEIYKIFLNKYKINPEEAVFFDDREENIEAANKLGIHGVHFPRHDSSIVYKNLFGYKLAKSIYEDINNIPYDFEPGRELEATYKLFLETNSMAITLQYEASKELMKIIKPVILEDKEFNNRAKELHLTLKCKLLPVKGSVISVLVLDGSQEYRDTPDARKLLNDIRASSIMIINKLSGLLKKYISKIDIGDGDEGCLYFHLNKLKAIVHDLKNKVVKEEEMDFPNVPIIFDNLDDENLTVNIQESLIEMAKREGIPVSIKDGNDIFEYYPPTKEKPYGEIGGVSISRGGFNESSIQEYGTTGGTIVGANQPDSVYIVNYMQNNVFSGYKEPKQAICKKGMNQMYTTKNGKAVPIDKDKFKEEASDVSVFRFKETPILSFDKIIENATVDEDFFLLLTGDFPEDRIGKMIEYDIRFVQEENFLNELDDITCCTESTITGQIEATDYPYMKVLTESVQGRCWNYYRDINGVFAMNELTGLRTPSYEDVMDIPKSQIQLIERGTVYLGE